MTLTLQDDENIETATIMAAGAFAGLLMNVNVFVAIYDKDWSWASFFAFRWISVCLGYMNTFFHELGHSVTYWFYGYINIPVFDFTYGGGFTKLFSGQLLILHLGLYGFLGYIAYQLREYRWVTILCAAIGLFHLGTAHTQFHEAFCLFAGPLAQIVVACFFLLRGWFDNAPNQFERFLSAAFGFGMTFYVLLDGWGLIHNDVLRLLYYEQKGGHALGDFDRIADITDIRFSVIIWFWMILDLLAIFVPASIYIKRNYFPSFSVHRNN